MDDLLKSVSNEETAIKLIQGVRKILADGGFHITKFVSNNKQVLASIPEDERRKGVLDQELEFGMLPTEKVLSNYWNTEEDSIGFEVRLKEKPNTKRGGQVYIWSTWLGTSLYAGRVANSSEIVFQQV